jgi:hypothetical protein
LWVFLFCCIVKLAFTCLLIFTWSQINTPPDNDGILTHYYYYFFIFFFISVLCLVLVLVVCACGFNYSPNSSFDMRAFKYSLKRTERPIIYSARETIIQLRLYRNWFQNISKQNACFVFCVQYTSNARSEPNPVNTKKISNARKISSTTPPPLHLLVSSKNVSATQYYYFT